MTLRQSLNLISVLLNVALITSCGSPEPPELGDSYDDVLKGLFFVERDWYDNSGSILVKKNMIIYKNVLLNADDVVFEFYLEDNVYVKSISITKDEDGSKLNNKLEGPLWRGKFNDPVIVDGREMYHRTYLGESEYLYREFSTYFGVMSLHEMKLLEE